MSKHKPWDDFSWKTQTVLQHTAYDGEQWSCASRHRSARRTLARQLVHLTCDPAIPMRRPLSDQAAEPSQGWVEILYKVLGPGLQALAARKVG